MIEIIYPVGEAEVIKEYKKYQSSHKECINRDSLQSFYETIRDNLNYFDRDYYIKVLEEKGYKF